MRPPVQTPALPPHMPPPTKQPVLSGAAPATTASAPSIPAAQHGAPSTAAAPMARSPSLTPLGTHDAPSQPPRAPGAMQHPPLRTASAVQPGFPSSEVANPAAGSDAGASAWQAGQRQQTAQSSLASTSSASSLPGAQAKADNKGWEQRVDKGSGQIYYVNVNTKESSWTQPAVSPSHIVLLPELALFYVWLVLFTITSKRISLN